MDEIVDNPVIAPKLTAETLDAKLKSYHVRREVGKGAMGIVYEAKQEGLARRVAIKVLPPNLALRDRTVKRFLREAEAMGRLAHANVVDIYEVGSEHDTLHYFAMQYVDGPPLDVVLRAGPLAIQDVVRIGIQVSDALAHAHSRGVMHRDIKPSNLLRSTDDVMLTDFGLARPLDSEETGTMTESGDLVGTPLYMSPEQISGDTGVIDGRSDVWGLGVTLYELLIQKPPFTGASATQILNKILHKDPPLLRKQRDDIPRDLEAVILKCLEKDPTRRYSGAAALYEDLCAVRDGHPVSASAPRFFDPALRWMRRNPAQSFIGLFAVLAITTLAIVSLKSSQRADDVEQELTKATEAVVEAEDDKETAVEQSTFREARIALLDVKNEFTTAALERAQAQARGDSEEGFALREQLAFERLTNLLQSYPMEQYPEIAAEALEVMASFFHQQDRDSQAIAMLEQTQFGESDSARLMVQAAFYKGLGQMEKALGFHVDRIDLNPDGFDAHFDAGHLSRLIGEAAQNEGNVGGGRQMLEQSHAYLNRALALVPEERDLMRARILTERAQCLIALSRADEADSDLEEALALDSTLALARALRERSARAQAKTALTPFVPAGGVLDQVFPGLLEVGPDDLEAAGEGIRSLFDGMRNLIGTTRGDGAADESAEGEVSDEVTPDASTPPGE